MTTKKKKRNFSKKNNSNGIIITDSISLTINSQYQLRAKIMLFIIALTGCASFIFSFLSLFDFDFNRKATAYVCIISFLIFSLSFLTVKISKYLPIPVLALTGFGIIKNYTSLKYGYYEFINVIINKVRPDLNTAYDISLELSEAQIRKCLTMFLCFLFVIIILTLCYNVIIKPRILLIFSVTFPFIEIGLYFGFSPDHTAFSFLIAFWTSVFSMRIAGNQFHSTTGKPVFVRKKNVFVSSGNLKNNVIETIGIFTLGSVLCIFITTSIILDLMSYERPENINDLRYSIKTSISDFSLEKIMHSNGDNNSNSPVDKRSRLGIVSEINFQNKTDITATIDFKTSGNLYLKGFIGADYSKNSWSSLGDNATSEFLDSFKELTQKGYCPQNFNSKNQAFYGHYNDVVEESSFSNVINHIMILSNFEESPYLFTPYSIIMENDMSIEDDGRIQSKFMNYYQYSFYEIPDFTNNSNIIIDEMNQINTDFSKDTKPQNLSEAEKLYKTFAEKYYLSYPDTEQLNELYEKYGSTIPKYDGTNISEITSCIRDILHSNSEYSLKPGKTPNGKDLVWYMLNENHKGYCSHFATSAVILARMAGVPARYAEGYVIVPSDFNDDTRQLNGYKIPIHDSRSHAWAEFYIDGFGWAPFEFTPGYDTGFISAESTENNETDVSSETTPPVTSQTSDASESVSQETSIVTKQVTEKTEASETSNKIEDKGVSKQTDHHILKAISFIINIFLLLIILFYARHAVVISLRDKKLKEGSNNERLINLYRYFLALLKSYGISDSNMFPLEFAEYAEENTKEICSEGEITTLIKLVEKASFSNESISDSELKRSASFIRKTALAIYNSKTRLEQFEFRYINNLIK